MAEDVIDDQKAAPSGGEGAPADSPPAGDAAGDSPAPQTEHEELLADVEKIVSGEQPPSPAAKADDVPPPKTDESGEEAKKVETAAALSQQDKSFEQRPEWQRLLKAAATPEAKKVVRETLRELYGRETTLNKQVKDLQPSAEVMREMVQAVQGNEVGFANMRALIRDYDSHPEKAVPMLEKLLEDAKARAGQILTSPELKTELQELEQMLGEQKITPEFAAKRKQELLELEKARITVKRTQTETDRTRQTETQRRTQETVREIQTAADNWRTDKLKNDPDFAPLESLHVSRTMQLADAKFRELGRMLTGKEAVEVAEEALRQVKAEVGKLQPGRPRMQPVRNGDSSTARTRRQPATEHEELMEGVDEVLKRHYG